MGLVELGECRLGVAHQRMSLGLLLGGESRDLRRHPRDALRGAGEPNGPLRVGLGRGLVGLAEEHVRLHVIVCRFLRPLHGPVRPVDGHSEVAQVLEEPPQELGHTTAGAEQVLTSVASHRVQRAHDAAGLMQHGRDGLARTEEVGASVVLG
ncbi:hypothetical protein [Streptomyces litchfieldiae]|uniref:Uncharacterized protein n=1 Tax=Streptomyces litchfieldiae TaxID=3075543 RepID=A0ABU2MMJ6_9ACTN|nr:hypothetical protein [Streptomyces sp. DSM 44938]MDT0342344.1 hypothetical protein [Streptomyces sp. DSM 44938]